MKGAPATCSVCGSRIHPAAFGKGGAIALLRRAYCPACLTKATTRTRDGRKAGLLPREGGASRR